MPRANLEGLLLGHWWLGLFVVIEKKNFCYQLFSHVSLGPSLNCVWDGLRAFEKVWEFLKICGEARDHLEGLNSPKGRFETISDRVNTVWGTSKVVWNCANPFEYCETPSTLLEFFTILQDLFRIISKSLKKYWSCWENHIAHTERTHLIDKQP